MIGVHARMGNNQEHAETIILVVQLMISRLLSETVNVLKTGIVVIGVHVSMESRLEPA